MRKRTSVFI